MADAGFFRGTTSEQDARFSDKNKKLMKAMKFEKSLSGKVDMQKVNMDIIKPWIVKRITELLSGIEDEVLIGYVFELLQETRFPDPKELQIAVTGFLNGKNARVFMGELWTHMLSAQENIGGIPADFLEKKKEEIRQRKQETERIQANLKKAQTVEADSTSSSRDILEKAQDYARKAAGKTTPIRAIKRESSMEAKPIPTTSDLNTPAMRDQKNIRQSLVGYMSSPAATPIGRDKPGWYAEHDKHVEISRTSSASVLLIGDSIIQGLARYPKIWNKYFTSLKALNFGMGGDRTQHVLWRVENGEIPLNAQMIVVHCGTNNVERDNPKDVACGVASIGMVFQEAKPNAKIILTGLLPRDLQPSYRREQVNKVNRYLKHFCKSGHIRNFYYLKPDSDWVLPDGTLNTTYYFQDYLHLVEEGDEKFAKAIYEIITKVYSGIKIEMSSDSEMSGDEDFALSFERKTGRPRSFSPSPSRRRSRSHSPRRRRRRSSSPRRYSPRRKRRRSYSRSYSRSPRRRSRHYSSSRSRSPVDTRNLVELTKQVVSPSPPPTHSRSNGKLPNTEREESEERVKIKPADEGLMKDDHSPTSYSKSEKTQNRAYRRKRSEVSEESEEEQQPDSIQNNANNKSPEIKRGNRRSSNSRHSPHRRSVSPKRRSGNRRRSPTFTPSPPRRRQSPDRRRQERRKRSMSLSMSPPQKRRKRGRNDSSDRSPSPDTRKREQKKREEEIRRRREAREQREKERLESQNAREKERRLAERLREKHRQRQRRRSLTPSGSGSDDRDHKLLRKKMLEEAERRLKDASSDESEKSDDDKKRNQKSQSRHQRRRSEESEESDQSGKRKQRRRKIEEQRRQQQESSDEEDEEDNRRVVLEKRTSPNRRGGKESTRPGDRRKHQSSGEEDDEQQERKRKRMRRESRESESDSKSYKPRSAREESASEESEEDNDERRVVIRKTSRRKSSSPDERRHRSPEESEEEKASASEAEEQNENVEKEEQEEESDQMIEDEQNKREESSPEESSPEHERRRHKSTKRDRKHKKHRKSSKSKKKRSKRRRRSSSEEEDDDSEGSDADSDIERALREKALKSIKKKSRHRRETSDDEISAD